MKTEERIIIITDCMECPKISKCKAWNKLTPKQKFILKTGIGIGKFILKDCPLKAYAKITIEAKIPKNAESEEALSAYATKMKEDYTKPSGIAMGWRACYEWILLRNQSQLTKQT